MLIFETSEWLADLPPLSEIQKKIGDHVEFEGKVYSWDGTGWFNEIVGYCSTAVARQCDEALAKKKKED